MAEQDPEIFNFKIPERQPFEGNATQKQKHRIWELGIRDEALIKSLGKQQAIDLIDALYAHYKKLHWHKAAAQNIKALGMVVIIGALLIYVAYKAAGGE